MLHDLDPLMSKMLPQTSQLARKGLADYWQCKKIFTGDVWGFYAEKTDDEQVTEVEVWLASRLHLNCAVSGLPLPEQKHLPTYLL